MSIRHSLLVHTAPVALALLLLSPLASAVSLIREHNLRAPTLHLRGGGMWGSKPAAPIYPPLPVATGGENVSSVVSGANLLADSGIATSLDGWRMVLAGSFALFFAFTSLPGRLDTKLGRPKREDGRFFTPSGWAFAIWGPIFLLEMVMSVSAAVAPGSLFGPAGGEWLTQMAPGYAAAALHQVVWTMTFRDWALDKLWIPATSLTLAAFGLYSAHGAVTRALTVQGSMSWYGFAVAAVPVGMHFGWMCCAAVLSWNNVLNQIKAKRDVQLTAATASCYAAAALLGNVAVNRRDPIPALVGCWALYAVSTGHEILRGAVDELALNALNLTAKLCSGISFVAAVAAFAVARLG